MGRKWTHKADDKCRHWGWLEPTSSLNKDKDSIFIRLVNNRPSLSHRSKWGTQREGMRITNISHFYSPVVKRLRHNTLTVAFIGSNPIWAAFYTFQTSTRCRMGNANWNNNNGGWGVMVCMRYLVYRGMSSILTSSPQGITILITSFQQHRIRWTCSRHWCPHRSPFARWLCGISHW